MDPAMLRERTARAAASVKQRLGIGPEDMHLGLQLTPIVPGRIPQPAQRIETQLQAAGIDAEPQALGT